MDASHLKVFIEGLVDKIRISPAAQAQAQADMANLSKSLTGLGREYKDLGYAEKGYLMQAGQVAKIHSQLTEDTDSFAQSLARGARRIAALGIASGAIFGVAKAMRDVVKTGRDVEESMVKINLLLRTSPKNVQTLRNELFKTARETGRSFQDVAAAAEEFARQGLSLSETAQRTKAALILVSTSAMSSKDAVDTLTSALKAFGSQGLTAADVANKLATVDARYATSAMELSEALRRTSASAREAGVTFDQLLGLITTVSQTTRLSASTIGTAYRTIFATLSSTKVQKMLQGIGVPTIEKGKFRPAFDVFRELSQRFGTLSETTRGDITEAIGGKRRRDIFLTLMREFQDAIDATNTSIEAQNEAFERNQLQVLTLNGKLNALKETYKELSTTVYDSGLDDAFKNITATIQGMGQILDFTLRSSSEQLDEFGMKQKKPGLGMGKGILPALTGMAIPLAFLLTKEAGKGIGRFVSEVALQFKKTGDATAMTRKELTSILEKIAILQFKEEGITIEKEKQVAALQQYARIIYGLGNIAPRARGVAVEAVTGMLGPTGRSVKGGAKGITTPEFSALVKEKTEAPRATPVLIRNFAFPDGKRGPVVVNDSEMLMRTSKGYHVIPTMQRGTAQDTAAKGIGLGRFGKFKRPHSLKDLLIALNEAWVNANLRMAGIDPKKLAEQEKLKQQQIPIYTPTYIGKGAGNRGIYNKAHGTIPNFAKYQQMQFPFMRKVPRIFPGSPIAYHGTMANFDKFAVGDLGFHFGTMGQAKDRLKYLSDATAYRIADLQTSEYEAAMAEAKQSSKIIEAQLNFRKTLPAHDIGNWLNPFAVIRELYKRGGVGFKDARNLIKLYSRKFGSRVGLESEAKVMGGGSGFETHDYWANLLSYQDFEPIRRTLRKRGFDSVSYRNEYEGKFGTSYIALKPSQIRRRGDLPFTGAKGIGIGTIPNLEKGVWTTAKPGGFSLNPIAKILQKKHSAAFFDPKGLTEAELKAILKEMREAPGTKPVLIRDFKFPTGKRGPVVVNDSEWLVKGTQGYHIIPSKSEGTIPNLAKRPRKFGRRPEQALREMAQEEIDDLVVDSIKYSPTESTKWLKAAPEVNRMADALGQVTAEQLQKVIMGATKQVRKKVTGLDIPIIGQGADPLEETTRVITSLSGQTAQAEREARAQALLDRLRAQEASALEEIIQSQPKAARSGGQFFNQYSGKPLTPEEQATVESYIQTKQREADAQTDAAMGEQMKKNAQAQKRMGLLFGTEMILGALTGSILEFTQASETATDVTQGVITTISSLTTAMMMGMGGPVTALIGVVTALGTTLGIFNRHQERTLKNSLEFVNSMRAFDDAIDGVNNQLNNLSPENIDDVVQSLSQMAEERGWYDISSSIRNIKDEFDKMAIEGKQDIVSLRKSLSEQLSQVILKGLRESLYSERGGYTETFKGNLARTEQLLTGAFLTKTPERAMLDKALSGQVQIVPLSETDKERIGRERKYNRAKEMALTATPFTMWGTYLRDMMEAQAPIEDIKTLFIEQASVVEETRDRLEAIKEIFDPNEISALYDKADIEYNKLLIQMQENGMGVPDAYKEVESRIRKFASAEGAGPVERFIAAKQFEALTSALLGRTKDWKDSLESLTRTVSEYDIILAEGVLKQLDLQLEWERLSNEIAELRFGGFSDNMNKFSSAIEELYGQIKKTDLKSIFETFKDTGGLRTLERISQLEQSPLLGLEPSSRNRISGRILGLQQMAALQSASIGNWTLDQLAAPGFGEKIVGEKGVKDFADQIRLMADVQLKPADELLTAAYELQKAAEAIQGAEVQKARQAITVSEMRLRAKQEEAERFYTTEVEPFILNSPAYNQLGASSTEEAMKFVTREAQTLSHEEFARKFAVSTQQEGSLFKSLEQYFKYLMDIEELQIDVNDTTENLTLLEHRQKVLADERKRIFDQYVNALKNIPDVTSDMKTEIDRIASGFTGIGEAGTTAITDAIVNYLAGARTGKPGSVLPLPPTTMPDRWDRQTIQSQLDTFFDEVLRHFGRFFDNAEKILLARNNGLQRRAEAISGAVQSRQEILDEYIGMVGNPKIAGQVKQQIQIEQARRNQLRSQSDVILSEIYARERLNEELQESRSVVEEAIGSLKDFITAMNQVNSLKMGELFGQMGQIGVGGSLMAIAGLSPLLRSFGAEAGMGGLAAIGAGGTAFTQSLITQKAFGMDQLNYTVAGLTGALEFGSQMIVQNLQGTIQDLEADRRLVQSAMSDIREQLKIAMAEINMAFQQTMEDVQFAFSNENPFLSRNNGRLGFAAGGGLPWPQIPTTLGAIAQLQMRQELEKEAFSDQQDEERRLFERKMEDEKELLDLQRSERERIEDKIFQKRLEAEQRIREDQEESARRGLQIFEEGIGFMTQQKLTTGMLQSFMGAGPNALMGIAGTSLAKQLTQTAQFLGSNTAGERFLNLLGSLDVFGMGQGPQMTDREFQLALETKREQEEERRHQEDLAQREQIKAEDWAFQEKMKKFELEQRAEEHGFDREQQNKLWEVQAQLAVQLDELETQRDIALLELQKAAAIELYALEKRLIQIDNSIRSTASKAGKTGGLLSFLGGVLSIGAALIGGPAGAAMGAAAWGAGGVGDTGSGSYMRQHGGWIPLNAGIPGKDSVPSLLVPGEYVVNARSARRHRGLLERINKYQKGGIVANQTVISAGDVAGPETKVAEIKLRDITSSGLSALEMTTKEGSDQLIAQNQLSTASTTTYLGAVGNSVVTQTDVLKGLSEQEMLHSETITQMQTEALAQNQISTTESIMGNTTENFSNMMQVTGEVANAQMDLASKIGEAQMDIMVSQIEAIGSLGEAFAEGLGSLAEGLSGAFEAMAGGAKGGPIFGRGTGASDSILARLSNGEFIMRSSSAKSIGYGALNYMNQTGQVPGFATGGAIDYNKLLETFGLFDLKNIGSIQQTWARALTPGMGQRSARTALENENLFNLAAFEGLRGSATKSRTELMRGVFGQLLKLTLPTLPNIKIPEFDFDFDFDFRPYTTWGKFLNEQERESFKRWKHAAEDGGITEAHAQKLRYFESIATQRAEAAGFKVLTGIHGYAPGYASHWPENAYAKGGKVDTIPAMLSPGEFVVNSTATARNLPLLQSINRGESTTRPFEIVNRGLSGIERDNIAQQIQDGIKEAIRTSELNGAIDLNIKLDNDVNVRSRIDNLAPVLMEVLKDKVSVAELAEVKKSVNSIVSTLNKQLNGRGNIRAVL